MAKRYETADLVAAVRADKVVGAGTCSMIDEAHTDAELAELLTARGATTPAAAVKAARSAHRVWADVASDRGGW